MGPTASAALVAVLTWENISFAAINDDSTTKVLIFIKYIECVLSFSHGTLKRDISDATGIILYSRLGYRVETHQYFYMWLTILV